MFTLKVFLYKSRNHKKLFIFRFFRKRIEHIACSATEIFELKYEATDT